MNKRVFDVGLGMAKIIKMSMGEKYTGIWALDSSTSGVTLEHYILVSHGVARSLRIGDSISLKVEVDE
jgi:redox-regulated HSP33 family molecular chaperone